MSALQAAVERRGQQIFDLVDQNPESLFTKAGFYQRMMAFSMRDETFKVQMFRFVDVLASLRRSNDIVNHLREYFHGMDGVVPMLQTGLARSRYLPVAERLHPAPQRFRNGAAIHRRPGRR